MASTSTTTYDLGAAVGHEFPAEPVTWTQRDLILFSLGVGAKHTDFNLIYEKSANFQAFTTFPGIFLYKTTETDIVDFFTRFASLQLPPGLPDLNVVPLIQSSQSVEYLKPIPKASTDGTWSAKRKVVGIHESPRGIIIDTELTLTGSDGTDYSKYVFSILYIKAVANGVPFDKVLGSPLRLPQPIKSLGLPLYQFDWYPQPETQGAIYFIAGDYNPCLIDPAVVAGFGKTTTILSGLSMLSFTAYVIVKNLCDVDASGLKYIYCNNPGPTNDAEGLRIRVWELGPGPQEGTTLIAFEARNIKDGYIAIGDGVAVIVKGKKLPVPLVSTIVPPIPAPGRPSTHRPTVWSPPTDTSTIFSPFWWFNVISRGLVYIPSLIAVAWLHVFLSIFQPLTRAVTRAN